MKRSKLLSDLFFTFFKIGLFTFGGGYAMIALIEDSCVNKRQYITHDEMMNITVIAESTPGPIAINCATFVGYKQAKTLGAVIATLGIVLPSFCIILAISAALSHILKHPLVQAALRGLKPCMVGIVFATGIFMVLQTALRAFAFDWKQILLVLLLGAVLFLAKPICKRPVSPILFICISALLGIVFYGV